MRDLYGIKEGQSITSLIEGDFSRQAKMARANYIYSDLTRDPNEVPTLGSFIIKELTKYYDLEDNEIDGCTCLDLEELQDEIIKLEGKGFNKFGVLDLMKKEDQCILLYVAKLPEEYNKDDQIIGFNSIHIENKDNEEAIRAGFETLLRKYYKAIDFYVALHDSTIYIGCHLGYGQPSGFDYMKYLISYRKQIVNMINAELGLEPTYAKVENTERYMGTLRIKYALDEEGINNVITLLKLNGLPLKYKDMPR